MRFSTPTLLAVFGVCSSAGAVNIVLANDDGWAESNIRETFKALTAAGHAVVLSAPAENQSGRSSLDFPPLPVGSDGCQYKSCSPNSPGTGANASDPRLNYVNSFPVTAMKYGVQTLAQTVLGGPAALVVSGVNVGSNLGLAVPFSGTCGAASAAADQLSLPGLAFSGSTGSPSPWTTTPPPLSSSLYADWALNLTTALLASTPAGTPYLPANTWLNVNFPAINTAGCATSGDVTFVLSRIYTAIPLISGTDVCVCGNGGRLPTESEVVGTKGCFASVSVGRANDKRDQEAAVQKVVAGRLAGLLRCLPKS